MEPIQNDKHPRNSCKQVNAGYKSACVQWLPHAYLDGADLLLLVLLRERGLRGLHHLRRAHLLCLLLRHDNALLVGQLLVSGGRLLRQTVLLGALNANIATRGEISAARAHLGSVCADKGLLRGELLRGGLLGHVLLDGGETRLLGGRRLRDALRLDLRANETARTEKERER